MRAWVACIHDTCSSILSLVRTRIIRFAPVSVAQRKSRSLFCFDIERVIRTYCMHRPVCASESARSPQKIQRTKRKAQKTYLCVFFNVQRFKISR